MESTTDWIWAVDMLGSKIFTFGPKSGPAAQAGAPKTSAPVTTGTARSARRGLIRISPLVDAVWPILLALRFDDHQVIRVVVAEEEQERHRAVAAHQLRVDVDFLRRELVAVGPRVGRLERDARHAPGLVVAARR